MDGIAVRQKIIIRGRKEENIISCWSANVAVKLMAHIPEKESRNIFEDFYGEIVFHAGLTPKSASIFMWENLKSGWEADIIGMRRLMRSHLWVWDNRMCGRGNAR